MLKLVYSKEAILNESINFNTLFKASPLSINLNSSYQRNATPLFSYSASAHVNFFPPLFDLQILFIDFPVIFSLSLET